MPVVKGKHYAYTKKGKDAAKKARAKQNESIAQIVVSRIVEAPRKQVKFK
tara:strand:+ start:491 stop:640 length:150 start_codon:yes stop_codon:yes gene_type:complete